MLLIIAAYTAAVLAPLSSLACLLLLPTLPRVWRMGLPTRSGLSWLMAIWLLWLPATLAWSLSPGLSIPQVAVLLCLPLGWLAGVELHQRGQLVRLLDYSLPSLLLILALWGLLQGPNTFTLKPQGPFNDPNTFAAVLNLLVLPILAHYLAADLARQASWRRTGQLALLAGAAFVAFLTSSRGASLAMLLVLPPLLWLARLRPSFIRKLVLLAVVVASTYLAAFAVSGGASVAQRLTNTIQGGDPSRIMLMRSALMMIEDQPWLGTGLGTFRLRYPLYRFLDEPATGGGWVHNDYLQLWLEAGLPMMLLTLGLVAWVAMAMWRALREKNEEVLPRMGYLVAIAAILLHALVNFLLFFSLVSLLLGLYLARLSTMSSLPIAVRGWQAAAPIRAIRLATGGYVLILAWLLFGQVVVEGTLWEARTLQKAFLKLGMTYPLYQVAYVDSVLAPYHPTPQQVMGLELADGYLIAGGGVQMRDAALDRLDSAWQRAPCYLPYSNDALEVIRQQDGLDENLSTRGEAIVARNLDCNARHGLSYFYAGKFAESDTLALEWWRAGMASSPYLADDLLLAAAILTRTTPGHAKELAALTDGMAQAIRGLEGNPGIHPDQYFWSEAQKKLYRLGGKRYLELVPPPKN